MSYQKNKVYSRVIPTEDNLAFDGFIISFDETIGKVTYGFNKEFATLLIAQKDKGVKDITIPVSCLNDVILILISLATVLEDEDAYIEHYYDALDNHNE